MAKIIDDNNMISNPVRWGRSRENLEVGETGIFNSSGWVIEGRVQKRYGDLWDYEGYHGVYIYCIENIRWITNYGLEMTDEEYEKELKTRNRRKR